MSKPKSAISQARTLREAAQFWDANSLADYWEKTRAVDFQVRFEPEMKYYPIKNSLAERLARIAEEREVPEEILLNTWIRDRIEEELDSL